MHFRGTMVYRASWGCFSEIDAAAGYLLSNVATVARVKQFQQV